MEQRFDFLYENYAVLKAIIKDYREDIITDVIEMKSFNRRAANGELGVRVQVSMGTSNPSIAFVWMKERHIFFQMVNSPVHQ